MASKFPAFVADVHIGNHKRFGGPVTAGLNERCTRAVDAFALALEQAERRAAGLVVAGDLFDSSRAEPQVIAAVASVMAKSHCPVLALVGNHDQESNQHRDHALAVLEHTGTVVVEEPGVYVCTGGDWRKASPTFDKGHRDFELWAVPFRHGKGKRVLRDGLEQCAEQATGAPIILTFHLGVSDDHTAKWLRTAEDSIAVSELMELMFTYGIAMAFAGNWHDRRQWRNEHCVVTQLGALVPTGWDNPGLGGYGSVDVPDLDAMSVEHAEVPGPRFIKARSLMTAPRNPLAYVQLLVSPDDAAQVVLASADFPGKVDVQIDTTATKAAATAAAKGARSAQTLDEAVDAYLSDAPLEEGVQRQAVVDHVRRYLATGVSGGLLGSGSSTVKRVVTRGFMRSSEEVLFPETGLVQVTGKNGAGKSTLVEAISVACWGKTVRGTQPWLGDTGFVEVEFADGMVVRREKRKAKVTLSFHEKGQVPVVYETTSKAQEALENRVGSWDVWRRSSVFTSVDAASFSLATDAERKRLLETVLGIDRFDEALDACRRDVKSLSAQHTALAREYAVAAARLDGARRRLEDAKTRAAEATDPGPKPQQPTEIQAALRILESELKLRNDVLGQLHNESAELRIEVRRAELAVAQARQNLDAKSSCPTCGRPFDECSRATLAQAVADAEAELPRVRELVRVKLADTIDRTNEARIAVDGLLAQQAEHRANLRAHSANLNAWEQHSKLFASAKDGVRDAAAELVDHEETLDDLECRSHKFTCDLQVLTAAEKALGTKGIRAHLLHRALGGLEQVSNAWLSRISGGAMSLRLSSYTEKATGGVRDAIALSIVGAGNGEGYRATSGGERRRVDVALVLGLGEMVTGARDSMGGTVFADEVFDALDVDGIAYVSDALKELAAERCVVVISHNPSLLSALRADVRWRVEAGHVIPA